MGIHNLNGSPVTTWNTDKTLTPAPSVDAWTISIPKPKWYTKSSTVRSSKRFIQFATCWTLFTTSFYYTSTVLLIPFTLESQAGVPNAQVKFYSGVMVACYSAVLIVGGPLAGQWADLGRSKKRPLLVAQAFLLVSVVIMWKATTAGVIIMGRLCHGVAGSIFWSAGQALLVDAFGPETVGNAVGYVDLSSSLGYLLAPIVGGLLLDKSGVDAVYGLSFGFACFGSVLSLVLAESGGKTIPGQSLRHEKVGASLRGRIRFMRIVLASRRLLAACLGCFVANYILVSYNAIAPSHLATVFGWSPWETGLAVSAWYGPKLLSIIPGKMADRFGARWMVVVGFASSIPCLFGLAMATENTTTAKSLFVMMTVCLSVTISFANTPITAEIVWVINEKKEDTNIINGTGRMVGGAREPMVAANRDVSPPTTGLGFGLFLFSGSIGATVGSLVSAKLVDRLGWSAAVYALVAWCAIGGLVCLRWTGSPRKKGGAARGRWPLPLTQEVDSRRFGVVMCPSKGYHGDSQGDSDGSESMTSSSTRPMKAHRMI
ncbi:major facilitator superfamily domain-containing protein [Podospora aff. communis PSN243]|uniref:Major facilitator superfamily domain-containing protein n=1 Tax=Podospora aff. communis PSN243 TaxID=3040156 RepID=A0AAV9FZ87_9PEZI|nr:major facilitator superfamily domain-containing protein [Podospora aff. communis PSN243]